MKPFAFREARPVWAAGKETELNFSLILRAVLPQGIRATLRVAGHTNYQIFVNGAFFAQGPARAGHGFFRADELDLADVLTNDKNAICILAAGYNANSFYLTDQPSFLCAEILSGDETLFATGTDRPFECAEYVHRQRKVQRYSFQRPFTESYICDALWDLFFTEPGYRVKPLPLEETAPKRFLARETKRSDYEERKAKTVTGAGVMIPAPNGGRKFSDRSRDGIDGVCLKGFRPEELEFDAVNELYGYASQLLETEEKPAEPVKLGTNCFQVYDMGLNTTGYIRLSLTAEQDAVIWAVFNEKLPADGVPDPGRDSCANVVRWALQGGRTYDLVSFEPYTYRYIQVISMYAPVLLTNVSQYCEHYPAAGLRKLPALPDAALETVRAAAVETFRQNATDIFMDCPSRERAGWLCDSFFTARTEYALTGESRIEKAFLENFLMEERFADIPAGMLPMCYPADHPDGTYIPNWAMWYALQLAEYKNRSGDTEMIAKAKEKLYALANFLSGFENENGLLERLQSWVFVEWSEANDFVQDVNYPTNMLYAKFLNTLGELYADAALCEKAARLREEIRRESLRNGFFTDNAVRENGELTLTGNHTETAQYYAFFCGVATPETDPELYQTLLSAFGPGRDPAVTFPDVPVSNAFIGNYLRLDILYQNGERERLLEEIRAFFLPMAESTGTLWENMSDSASCCHGFASHVAYWLNGLFPAEKD